MDETSRRTETGRRTALSTVSSTVIQLSSYLALALALSLFLGISLHQLTLPGFYYDEGLDLAPMLQVMHGEPVPLLRDIGVAIGSVTYPVMLLDYMGSLNGYLTLPFMLLFGSGVVAARIAPILFSAITIVLTFGLARAWFGGAVAMVAVLLLAVNPSFIWFSRQGISVTSVMTVFSVGSLLLIEQWRQRRRDWRLEIIDYEKRAFNLQSPRSASNLPLLFAGVFVGLGLWAKFLFVWWIVVIAVVALVWIVLHRADEKDPSVNEGVSGAVALRLRPILHNASQALRALPWLAAGFIIGAAPLIYYNLHDLLSKPFDLRNAYTLGLLFKSLGQTTDYGVNNLDVLTNLGKAIADFNVFVDGSYFWYNGVPFSNVYAVPTFVIAVVVGSLLVYRRAAWRKWLALLAAITVTVFISAFTVSGLWATHLFIILPLPQMVVAAAAVWLATRLGGLAGRIARPQAGRPRGTCQDKGRPRGTGQDKGRPRGTGQDKGRPQGIAPTSAPISLVFLCLLLALPFSRDLWVSAQHHAKLAETGGSGRFSDAVYKLADHLDRAQLSAPIALDWGIEKNVRVLTDDRVRPEEVFGFTAEPDDAFKNRVKDLLKDPARQYIVLWDRFAVYNRRKAFTQLANEMGLQVTETYIAHERSGLPVYVMLQAK